MTWRVTNPPRGFVGADLSARGAGRI